MAMTVPAGSRAAPPGFPVRLVNHVGQHHAQEQADEARTEAQEQAVLDRVGNCLVADEDLLVVNEGEVLELEGQAVRAQEADQQNDHQGSQHDQH